VLVSVVIPAYNRAGSLSRAVQSVMDQTCRDLEVLVVDDGSTDGTPQVAAGLAAGDGRIRCHRHESNRGAQAARNTGIRQARGEWVAFLDSDDELLPDSLEARLAVARSEGVDVVHSDGYVVDAATGARTPHGEPPISGQVFKALLRRWGVFYQSLLVRKAALKQIGLLDESIVSHQEWDTAIRLARLHPFGYASRPTFLYYRRGEGTISGNKRQQAVGYLQVVEKHREDIVRLLGRARLAQHYFQAAQLYRAAQDKPGARRWYFRSALAWPFGRTALNGIVRTLRSL
jgi:glycosyltransferase involved in cell wall biosynthesis